MSLLHLTGLNRTQRRESVRLLLEMRHVYPGDCDDALYRTAMELDPRLPHPRAANIAVYDAA